MSTSAVSSTRRPGRFMALALIATLAGMGLDLYGLYEASLYSYTVAFALMLIGSCLVVVGGFLLLAGIYSMIVAQGWRWALICFLSPVAIATAYISISAEATPTKVSWPGAGVAIVLLLIILVLLEHPEEQGVVDHNEERPAIEVGDFRIVSQTPRRHT